MEFSISTNVAPLYKAPCPTSAPVQDLALLKSLLAYPDNDMTKVTSTTFGSQVWYLSEQLLTLAFFDDNVRLETKRNNVKAIQEQDGCKNPSRRVTLDN